MQQQQYENNSHNSNLSWVRMLGKKVSTITLYKTREDTNLQPMWKPYYLFL